MVRQQRPCQAPGVTGSAMGLVDPVAVHSDRVKQQVGSATSISVWQHVHCLNRSVPGYTSTLLGREAANHHHQLLCVEFESNKSKPPLEPQTTLSVRWRLSESCAAYAHPLPAPPPPPPATPVSPETISSSSSVAHVCMRMC